MKKIISVVLICCLLGTLLSCDVFAEDAVARVKKLSALDKAHRERGAWLATGIGGMYLVAGSAIYLSDPNNQMNVLLGSFGAVFSLFFIVPGMFALFSKKRFETYYDRLQKEPAEEREKYAAYYLKIGAAEAKEEREITRARGLMSGQWLFALFGLAQAQDESPAEKEYREYMSERLTLEAEPGY